MVCCDGCPRCAEFCNNCVANCLEMKFDEAPESRRSETWTSAMMHSTFTTKHRMGFRCPSRKFNNFSVDLKLQVSHPPFTQCSIASCSSPRIMSIICDRMVRVEFVLSLMLISVVVSSSRCDGVVSCWLSGSVDELDSGWGVSRAESVSCSSVVLRFRFLCQSILEKILHFVELDLCGIMFLLVRALSLARIAALNGV